MRRVFFLIVIAGVALAVASCGPTDSTQQLSSPPPGGREGNRGGGQTPPPDANASPGQAVFTAQNCGKCHALNGVGKGMDLSKVGAKHDKAWIADHIRDPQKHNDKSTMPKYPEDKLSAKDLETVSEFLAGLK